AVLADELEGDGAAHFLMAGLEDQSHAALAEPFQDNIGTQQQVRAAPLKQLIDLVRGQPAAPNQFAGKGACIGALPLEGANQLIELCRLQESVLLEGIDKTGNGTNGHGGTVAGE